MFGLHDEEPLTMNELSVGKRCDFDFKYGQKTASVITQDLMAIDRSMMQRPKRDRRRFKKKKKYPKFRFAPSLEVIQEHELFETKGEHVMIKLDKDLAAIHEERALGCGPSPSETKEDGRRYRYKKRAKSSRGKEWLQREKKNVALKQVLHYNLTRPLHSSSLQQEDKRWLVVPMD